MSNFKPDKTNKCRICGYRDESKIGTRKHIMMDHTTKEKLDSMIKQVPISEQEA